MKWTITLITCLLANATLSQITCQHHKQHAHSSNFLRSAADNLRSDTIDVHNYDVYLDFTQMGSQQISGNVEVRFEALMATNTLSLDLLQLNVDSIVHSTGPLGFNYNDTLIVVYLPATMNANDMDSITVYYNGSPQQDASGWGGFYFQGNYAYNLGVGFAADPHNYGRVWHPCFDNFAERATYEFRILTNQGRTAYCNGELISQNIVSGDTILNHWVMTDDIPSYLANVAVAPYTHADVSFQSPVTSDTVPVWLISEPSDTNDFKASFTNIDEAISGFELMYGPHSWNKVGFVSVPFNAGAMEHATNICYPALAINGTLGNETLMAHELAHHWWGDLVTCQTEEEMWINEGMASYSEKIFLEYVYGRTNYMNEVRDNHHHVVHLHHILDSGYYALNAVPHAYTYGEHSYEKGADVVHTLRGYLGDTLFFAGLQSVLTNYAWGNLSSIDFRDHLNSVLPVDVTDFFNDWILNPGYSTFGIIDMSITGGGPYDVDIVIEQKLRGAPNFHNNVPMQITFMDDNWNEYSETISLSGQISQHSFQVPFSPEFAALNMDELINDATTAETNVISSTGLKDMPYANCRFTTSAVTDSTLIRVEHAWVHPSFPSLAPANVALSTERYWNILGIADAGFDATMRFEYNGQENSAGYLDNALLVDLGGQPFIEDSIVLLYRPDAQSAWTIHTDNVQNFQGLHTDKRGTITTNSYTPGQYTFGYKTTSVGIKELAEKQDFSMYPNPAYEALNIGLSQFGSANYKIRIMDLNGKLALEDQFTGTDRRLDISGLTNGGYVVTVIKDGQVLGTERLIVSR